jgi:transposase-like protein
MVPKENDPHDGDPVNEQARPCPSCQSANTIRTHVRFNEQMFFCGDCEHSWADTMVPKTRS